MNTPPRRKRYEKPPPQKLSKKDIFVGTIEDPKINEQFSLIVTGFVYLEERMASVLAVLLGASDAIASGYVLQAIKSPSGRIDVMKELLERAPINKKLGDEYDHIIREFRAISAQRNLLAHGKWWTDFRTNETILDETEDPNISLHVRRVVTVEELELLDKRIFALHVAIHKGPEAELERRRRAGLRLRRAPSPSKRPRRNVQK